jgi:hypothetical protein
VGIEGADGEHLLAPLGRAARDGAGGGSVIDDDAEDAAEGEGLERELGAYEGERADLAAEVGGGVGRDVRRRGLVTRGLVTR